MKAMKGVLARRLARGHEQPVATPSVAPVPAAMKAPPVWDATRFRVLLKMAKNRIDIQRGKKENEIQATRIVIANHLRSHKETLARIQAERILRELSQKTAFDVVDTFIELLLTQNNVLAVQRDFDAAPQDVKENVASVVFASSRLNVPELQTVCSMLREHFGPAVIDPLRTLSGPNIKYINKTLAINLEGGTPDGYRVLEELSSIATEHQVNWIPPPEDIHLDQGSSLRSSDPGYYRPERIPQATNIPGMNPTAPPFNIPGHAPYNNMPFGGAPPAPHSGMQPSAPPSFDPSAGAPGTMYPYNDHSSHLDAPSYIPPPPSAPHSSSSRNNRGPDEGGAALPMPKGQSFLNDDALEARFRELRKK